MDFMGLLVSEVDKARRAEKDRTLEDPTGLGAVISMSMETRSHARANRLRNEMSERMMM